MCTVAIEPMTRRDPGGRSSGARLDQTPIVRSRRPRRHDDAACAPHAGPATSTRTLGERWGDGCPERPRRRGAPRTGAGTHAPAARRDVGRLSAAGSRDSVWSIAGQAAASSDDHVEEQVAERGQLHSCASRSPRRRSRPRSSRASTVRRSPSTSPPGRFIDDAFRARVHALAPMSCSRRRPNGTPSRRRCALGAEARRRGCRWMEGRTRRSQLDVVDTTGAGDALAAGTWWAARTRPGGAARWLRTTWCDA